MRPFTVLLALLATLGLTSPAAATTTRVEFTGSQQTVAVIDPGETWMSGPIVHVRGRVLQAVLMPQTPESLPEGDVTITHSFTLDTRTFEGRAWSQSVVDFGDGGFEVTSQGSFHPAAVPGGLLGDFEIVGQGFGAYEGMQVRATFHEFVAVGFGTFEGVLFTPGDR
jgi:hypothetical protein